MLATLNYVLGIAKEKQIAVGSFNCPNMSTALAVIGAAEELGVPVVIMHAQLHEDEWHISKMKQMCPLMRTLAEQASVPVCVHLDHGTSVDYVKRGLAMGFTSVMYDGSNLHEEENTKNTIEVVKEAKLFGASVEAEIGTMGTREGGNSGAKSIYTIPSAAKRFAEATGIDALACAFGTAHGFYATAPKLDFDRLSEINSLVDIPLVMHGGSGVSNNDYREVISRGVRKINYYTYMAKAGAAAVSGKQYTQFHDALTDGENAMKENVKNAIRIFSEIM